jgi:hypothetical protein
MTSAYEHIHSESIHYRSHQRCEFITEVRYHTFTQTHLSLFLGVSCARIVRLIVRVLRHQFKDFHGAAPPMNLFSLWKTGRPLLWSFSRFLNRQGQAHGLAGTINHCLEFLLREKKVSLGFAVPMAKCATARAAHQQRASHTGSGLTVGK